MIVGDVIGTGALSGADAAVVAQKSVNLPTPQIPDLPGIPLVPNGGGSVTTALASNATTFAAAMPSLAAEESVFSAPTPSIASGPIPSTLGTKATQSIAGAEPVAPVMARLINRDAEAAPPDMFSPMLLPLTPQSVSPMAIDSHGTHVGGDNETEPADTISTPVAANQLFDRYFEQFEQTQTALRGPCPA